MSRQMLVVGTLLLAASGCAYDSHAQRGAVLGGLTGSAVGAAIGEANDEPLAGAAIGAVAGALTGTAIGDGVDQREAAAQARANAHQQWSAQAVTPDQVVQMSQSGLSEDVIVTHIQTHGVRFSPTANDLIALKSQGVPDRVLNALQTQASRPVVMPVAVPPRPVIVEEHYYAPYGPWHHHRFGPRRRPGYCGPASRGYFGFSYSSR